MARGSFAGELHIHEISYHFLHVYACSVWGGMNICVYMRHKHDTGGALNTRLSYEPGHCTFGPGGSVDLGYRIRSPETLVHM